MNIQIIYRAPATLKPNSRNPRSHSKKQIRQIAHSIETFGFVIPVLINARGEIICGHGRVSAALQLGLPEIPTICVDYLSEAQIKALAIADNRLTENSEWDEKILTEELKELSELDLDFSIEVTGFSMGEIDFRIASSSASSQNAPDSADVLPPLANIAVSEPGDLWQLDKHRLYCGSALQSNSYNTLMGNAKAQMVFTDPPYNVPIHGHVCGKGINQHREFQMASGEMTDDEFASFLFQSLYLTAAYCHGGSILFWCMDWRHIESLLMAGRKARLDLKNLCVWVKHNAGMGSFYRSQHEIIAVFKNGTVPHKNNGAGPDKLALFGQIKPF